MTEDDDTLISWHRSHEELVQENTLLRDRCDRMERAVLALADNSERNVYKCPTWVVFAAALSIGINTIEVAFSAFQAVWRVF